MSKEQEQKELLLRSLITKICEEKEYIDLKYDKEFFGNYYLLFKKINDRKKDIPSLKYLEDTFKFEPHESKYTIRDTIEKLNQLYYHERSAVILKNLIAERKSGADTGDVIASLDNLNKEFSKIRGVITDAQIIDIANEPEKVVEQYRKLLEEVTYIPTGFKYIDEVCKPRLGNFLMLCAGTSQGKSLLMTLMQKAALESGVPSLYISLEMTLIEQCNRLLALSKIIPFEKIDSCVLTPEEYGKEIAKLKKVNTHILTMDTESKINLQTVERYISEVKPKVVFLDYMTLLQDSDFSWNAATSVSAELKRMALQYKVLMVTAVQADTSSMQAGEIPELWNVRGNKSFPHDANIFIGFASERYMIDPDNFKFRFAIRKNRNGGVMEFAYKIRPENGSVEDISGTLQGGL